jgi:hypothetical protein
LDWSRQSEEGAKTFGVFHVKKITILCQKIIFFPIAEGGAKIFGVFHVKNHDFMPKNLIFSNFRGPPTPAKALSRDEKSKYH